MSLSEVSAHVIFMISQGACLLCRAIEHAVDLPAVFVFPSWRTNTRPTSLPVSDSAEELVSHINSALLHPMVIELCRVSFSSVRLGGDVNSKYDSERFLRETPFI